MKGRRKVPTALALLRGNPGKRPINKREPKPQRMIPSAPEHLSDNARVAWVMMATRLDRLGLLTELDAYALEQLCENYAEILALREDVAEGGRQQTVETKAGGVMVRAMPAVSQLADAERRFASMMDRFGLNPSARSRVKTAGDEEAKNPFAALGG